MILRKTKSLSFNQGHFEKFEVFATMEINTEVDTDFKDATADDVMDYIDRTLEEFVAPDVVQVKETTDNEDSFVFPYIEITTNNKKDK
jgi:hypothetical protein